MIGYLNCCSSNNGTERNSSVQYRTRIFRNTVRIILSIELTTQALLRWTCLSMNITVNIRGQLNLLRDYLTDVRRYTGTALREVIGFRDIAVRVCSVAHGLEVHGRARYMSNDRLTTSFKIVNPTYFLALEAFDILQDN